MQLTSSTFQDNQPIPGEYAFAVPDPQQHVTLSTNRNPPLAWSDLPAGANAYGAIRLRYCALRADAQKGEYFRRPP